MMVLMNSEYLNLVLSKALAFGIANENSLWKLNNKVLIIKMKLS